MNRAELTTELLNLVDASPMSYVDIAPIIEKYTENKEYDVQTSIRVTITEILRELQKNGEIDYNKNDIVNILVAAYRQFDESSLLIRSTYKRQKEIETKKEEKPVSFNFEDNSINAEKIDTLIKDSQFRDFRPSKTPEINTNDSMHTKQRNPLLTWIIKHIWQIVIGVVIVLISSYIINHYHLFQNK
jgi:hypothetical protein